MEHFLGFFGLLCAALVTLLLAIRYPCLRWVLLAAFLVRAGAALFHFYIAPLPDGTADARSFESRAWLMAQDGLAGAVSAYTGPHSYFISWIISLLYALTDRSLLLAQSLSVLLGTAGVYLVWRLTLELWGERAAIKAAWVAALFPTLVLYSALTMREVYVVFFLLLGLLGTVRWARCGGPLHMGTALAGFIGATFFHGAMFVALLAFLGLAAVRYAQACLPLLPQGRLRLVPLVLLLAIVISGALFARGEFRLPKIGNPSHWTEERLTRQARVAARSTASYPDWLVPSNTAALVLTAPARAAYLLFAPFPWDVTYPRHLIGMVDGILYMFLAVLIWRQRRAIWSDAGARAVLLVILALVVVFTFGVGNFGTGLRHRSKFVVGLIVLAAPMLPWIVWKKGHAGSVLKTQPVSAAKDMAG